MEIRVTSRLPENATPNPRSPYAVSKLAAEYYVRTIGDLWGIETVILRVFNAYGPGQHMPASHAPVIPHYLRQVIRGGTLVMHGDGAQTRDYVYVDDVVSALISAATAPGINHMVNQYWQRQRDEHSRPGAPVNGSDRDEPGSALQSNQRPGCFPHAGGYPAGAREAGLPAALFTGRRHSPDTKARPPL